jgi:hypothetical protein
MFSELAQYFALNLADCTAKLKIHRNLENSQNYASLEVN